MQKPDQLNIRVPAGTHDAIRDAIATLDHQPTLAEFVRAAIRREIAAVKARKTPRKAA